MNTYTKIIQIKVSNEQVARIKKVADDLGLPMTAYCRFQVLKHIKSLEATQ